MIYFKIFVITHVSAALKVDVTTMYQFFKKLLIVCLKILAVWQEVFFSLLGTIIETS